MKLLIVLALLIFHGDLKAIELSVYTDFQKEFDQVQEGVLKFRKSVKENCGFEIDFKIQKSNFIDSVPFLSRNPKEMKEKMNELVMLNPFEQKGVHLFVVQNLGGVLCGYAFPQIVEDESFSFINTILIQQGEIACGSKERLVAHEMAHLFIQDNPPHSCVNDLGEQNDCPVDNILKNEIVIYSGTGRNQKPHYIRAKGLKIEPLQCEEIKKTISQID